MKHRRKLFCEYDPLCYRIAAEKECLRRDCSDFLRRTPLARRKQKELPEDRFGTAPQPTQIPPAVWRRAEELLAFCTEFYAEA